MPSHSTEFYIFAVHNKYYIYFVCSPPWPEGVTMVLSGYRSQRWIWTGWKRCLRNICQVGILWREEERGPRNVYILPSVNQELGEIQSEWLSLCHNSIHTSWYTASDFSIRKILLHFYNQQLTVYSYIVKCPTFNGVFVEEKVNRDYHWVQHNFCNENINLILVKIVRQ